MDIDLGLKSRPHRGASRGLCELVPTKVRFKLLCMYKWHVLRAHTCAHSSSAFADQQKSCCLQKLRLALWIFRTSYLVQRGPFFSFFLFFFTFILIQDQFTMDISFAVFVAMTTARWRPSRQQLISPSCLFLFVLTWKSRTTNCVTRLCGTKPVSLAWQHFFFEFKRERYVDGGENERQARERQL